MDERLQFVARRLAGEPMADLCREFGISRKAGYKIFGRSYGEKTRRPGHCPQRQLMAQRPSMINQAREVCCQGRFPTSLLYVPIVSPSPAVPPTFIRF